MTGHSETKQKIWFWNGSKDVDVAHGAPLDPPQLSRCLKAVALILGRCKDGTVSLVRLKRMLNLTIIPIPNHYHDSMRDRDLRPRFTARYHH